MNSGMIARKLKTNNRVSLIILSADLHKNLVFMRLSLQKFRYHSLMTLAKCTTRRQHYLAQPFAGLHQMVLPVCTGISAHSSSRTWRTSSRFLGGFSILEIDWPNSSQICSMGSQSGDLTGSSILVMLPCWRTPRARLGVALSSW